MATRKTVTIMFSALVAGCATSTDVSSAYRCPRFNEFPPHACAIVHATARDLDGRVLASMWVTVDSFIAHRGYHYAADGVTTKDDGSFELLVLRLNDYSPITTPDTASLDIKLYPNAVDPLRDQSFIAKALVKMTFAPLEQTVEPFLGDIVFPIRR